jgi:hypothetical protein
VGLYLEDPAKEILGIVVEPGDDGDEEAGAEEKGQAEGVVLLLVLLANHWVCPAGVRRETAGACESRRERRPAERREGPGPERNRSIDAHAGHMQRSATTGGEGTPGWLLQALCGGAHAENGQNVRATYIMSQQMYTEQPMKNIFMHVLYSEMKVTKRSRYRATNTTT